MNHRTLIIGTRGSELALWQAHFVQAQLRAAGLPSELLIIKTSGDRIQHLGFDKMEGKGFFTKELEEALLNAQIDLAVHSHKDLETTQPEGLTIAAVSERADCRDVLLIRPESYHPESPNGLHPGAILGTSSARRKAQANELWPDVQLKDLRGNVPTRVAKLRNAEYDAILLAKAGIDRLELDLGKLIMLPLDPEYFIPAPAQGVLGIQVRSADSELIARLKALSSAETEQIIGAERYVLKSIHGGCQLPLGVHCVNHPNGEFTLNAAYAAKWDAPVRRYSKTGKNPMSLAEQIAQAIKASHGDHLPQS